MAVRPVFVPKPDRGPLVEIVNFDIVWHGGFALSQKQKNVSELHRAAERAGIGPVLEISTKSPLEVGRRLSAFSLKLEVTGEFKSLESVYQSSKVFSVSGQHLELMDMDPYQAKKEVRRLGLGEIVAFEFEGKKYPTEPKNAFYDWLYLRAIAPHEDWIKRNLHFSAYSDIEFNPNRSINCQGRAVAEFHALSMRGVASDCMDDFYKFHRMLSMSQRHE